MARKPIEQLLRRCSHWKSIYSRCFNDATFRYRRKDSLKKGGWRMCCEECFSKIQNNDNGQFIIQHLPPKNEAA